MRFYRLCRTFLSQFKINNVYKLLRSNSRLNIYLTTCPIFHTSFCCFGKSFQECENEYTHKVMENNSQYKLSLIKHPLMLNNVATTDDFEDSNVFTEFFLTTKKNLFSNISLEKPEFNKLIFNLSNSLSIASDDTVIKILHFLCLWPPSTKTYASNYKLIWNTLDYECTRRLTNWYVNRKLLVADYWFHLRLSRITKYNPLLILNLIQNIDILSDSQIVQLMFYINLQRNTPQNLLDTIAHKIEIIIEKITIEEVGIVCLGYFKTQNKIVKSAVIEAIIKKLIIEIEEVNTITIASILKFLRKSLNRDLIDLYISLMHKCIPYIYKLDIPTSVHLALLSSEISVYHPLLLDKVTEKVALNIKNSRIKDGTKLLQCLSHFNHFPLENFHVNFIREIKNFNRKDELRFFPKDKIYTQLFYAYMGFYDYDLLTQIFNKNFVNYVMKNYHYLPAHVLVELDYCIEIECKDYQGPRLDKKYLEILNNRRGNMPSTSSQLTKQTKLINDFMYCIQEILGNDDNLLIRHILPHLFTPDIIYRLNDRLDLKPLSELCKNFSKEQILLPPPKETWVCFVIGGLTSFPYKSKYPCGVIVMKLRQLAKLGYKVIFVPYYEMPLDIMQLKNYIKEKLCELEKNYKIEKNY